MAQPVIQYSFHAGEWAPALNARVDLAKYHTACALAENWFVDYRGGMSTRAGTSYVIQCLDSTDNVRLIPFQASETLGYICEFGAGYVRFIRDGAPVLAVGETITGITQANPAVVTSAAHGHSTGDWIFINGVTGMTQINNNYYSVVVIDANHYSLRNILDGSNVNSTLFNAYISGGTAQGVYTIFSPYASSELRGLKFAQDVDKLTICHPNHPPFVLTFIAETNWTLTAINFGSTAVPPTSVSVSTTLAAGPAYYSYCVTSVDSNGQESAPSALASLSAMQDLRTTAGTNVIQWAAATNASFYNVYKASISYGGVLPVGVAYGYIGNCTGTEFIDSNINEDFSQTPPIAQNPFFGSGVVSYTVTVPGTYTTVPNVTVAGPPGGTTAATANAVLQGQGTPTIGAAGTGYAANDTVTLSNGVVVVVNTIGGGGAIATFKSFATAGNPGNITAGVTPANPIAQTATSGGGTGATVNVTWGVGLLTRVSSGSGYSAPPAVSFNPAGASATAVLGAALDLNPTVPGYFQQRLFLGGLAGLPNAFYLSQPGAPYDFDISNPIKSDDSIAGALVSGQLNAIKSVTALQSGMLVLTDRAVWLITGGSTIDGITVTPSNIAANPHSYVGASDVPPIVINFDTLYVQAKGSVVRDLSYNIYANVFTGTDISVLSSHLFYGFQVVEWAWVEEPFKTVWAIRDEGTALTLTFVKEQELAGWTHSITQGSFESVATTIESTDFGDVDACYFVVQRTINGNNVKFIERLADRIFPNGKTDAWCVDAGIQYVGTPATHFSGAQHLAGMTCTGLADGLVIPSFVMGLDGTFTLATPASKVTVGLAFLPKFQTLQIDLQDSDGTVQGRMKQISGVTVRADQTLGLSIGRTFDASSQVSMNDFILGELGTDTNEIVTDLVTGDAYQVIDASYTVPGQYCITQPLPYPATILGVMPEVAMGDTQGKGGKR